MPPRRRAKPRSAASAALGRVLQELRREAGLTQEQVAERIGTDFTQIGHLERGTTDPRFSTLLRLSQGLDVRLEEIVRRFERYLAEEALRESERSRRN